MTKTTRKKLNLNQLEIYPDAQRELSEKWAQDIAAEFNPDAVGVLIVAHFKDHYYIMDGQTRKRAFELLGKPNATVDCLIHEQPTVEEMAALFLLHNHSRRVKAFDKFRVRLTAKDPVALDIVEVCGTVGLKVNAVNKSSNVTSAVGALEKIYTGKILPGKKTDGPPLLKKTLDILKAAWDGERDNFHGDLLKGLAAFLARYESDISTERLIRQMSRYTGGPSGFLRNAKSIQSIRRIQPLHAFGSLFVDVYNKGLKTNTLDEWRR